MEGNRRLIISTLINSVPVNKLQAICEEFALDAAPDEGVDELRRRVREHVFNLYDALDLPPAEAPPPVVEKPRRFVKDAALEEPWDDSGIRPLRKITLKHRS